MTSAKEVPALVAAHQEFLLAPAYEEYAMRFFNYMGNSYRDELTKNQLSEVEQGRVARNWIQTEHNMLNIASLYHISESMTEIAKVAASQLSPLEKWNFDVAPSRNGVIVFEKPLQVMDAWERVVTFGMISWMYEDGGFSLSLYTDVETKEDYYNQVLQHQGELQYSMGRWQPCHMQRHADGEPLGNWITKDSPEYAEYREHNTDMWPNGFTPIDYATPGERPIFGNIGTILFAIFALMDQSIVSLSEETDKRLARRNRNKRRPPPMVTVIRLRREEQHGYREPGTGIWLNYRAITKGHWRRQHYGAGRTEVRRIYINPYWRGPEDAPIWQPKRVHTLVR